MYSAKKLVKQESDRLGLAIEQRSCCNWEFLCLQDRYYLSDEYKLEVLEHMSIPQLIESIMTNPTVHISPSYRDTGLSASYTFQPLSNLVYTRDQQITTANGIVMGRLRSSQRQLEVDLMRFCFQKLGLPHSTAMSLQTLCLRVGAAANSASFLCPLSLSASQVLSD